MVTAGAVGALVAAGGWLLLAGGGRRVREVLVLDEAAATRGPARPTRRPLGRPGRRPGSRPGPGGDVRVLVMQVVALLRAGASPGVAWSRAAGVGAGLTGVPDQDGLAQVLGPRHAEAVVAATRLALDVGAPLGRVLEEVAGTLVAEAEATADRDAALAAPRTTGQLLVWLPLAGALLGWGLGADPVASATDGGVGTASVVLGLVLAGLGRVWADRLVAAARGPDRPGVDLMVQLALTAAALRAGAGVPRALEAVGAAIGGADGDGLVRAARALVLGAPWDRAWAGVPAALAPLGRALAGAWVDGASPSEALRAAGDEVRLRRRVTTRHAAARLGVRMVLPTGLCYLPAFLLVGLVPVLLALGIDLLAG
ncbi:type II secretion system F family protein [Promicromonospora citrea]|uniref:type II secretion system F family protein n=2 Tax=Promicromonospora citrea TaxID=43677 RepID=UPI001E5A01D1|nr:type II secretion system F family protein [Promicromonospora citrea]